MEQPWNSLLYSNCESNVPLWKYTFKETSIDSWFCHAHFQWFLYSTMLLFWSWSFMFSTLIQLPSIGRASNFSTSKMGSRSQQSLGVISIPQFFFLLNTWNLSLTGLVINGSEDFNKTTSDLWAALMLVSGQSWALWIHLSVSSFYGIVLMMDRGIVW